MGINLSDIASVGRLAAALWLFGFCARLAVVEAIKLNRAGFLNTAPALVLATVLGVSAMGWSATMQQAGNPLDWRIFAVGVGVTGYALFVQLLIAKLRFIIAQHVAHMRGWDEERALYEATRKKDN